MKNKTRLIGCILLLTIPITGCNRSMPLDSGIWNNWDAGMIDNRRYDMAVWMIKTNWFEGKNKQDIMSQLPEHFPYEITGNIRTFEVKQTEGWNIDFVPQTLAYLKIQFNNNDQVIKAELYERKASFSDKLDGLGKISDKKYTKIMIWESE